MPQRTVSIPQIQGIAARDSAMHEILTRLRDAVNTALTLPAANGVPVKAKSSITLSNPVTRVIGPGTVHTIEGGDFGVPVWIIATGEDVGLATGGNIASGATVRAGYAVALIFDSKTGLFWPSKHTVYAEDVIGLGTAATRDVPAAGNAAADEVVLGSDTRLTGGSPLTVKEDDGTPSVANVTELRFSGATVEEVSAGVVRVTVTGGGGSAFGDGVVVADVAPPLPTAFVLEDGLISSAARTTFTGADCVQADALATPPTGWAWFNTGVLSSADVNWTTAGRVRLVHPNSAYSDHWLTAHTAQLLYRQVVADELEITARLHRYDRDGSRGSNLSFGLVQPHGVHSIRNGFSKFNVESNGDLTLCASAMGGTHEVARTNLSSTEMSTGVWVRVNKRGAMTTWSYSKEDSVTPPTTWVEAPWTTDLANVGMLRSAPACWAFIGLGRWGSVPSAPTAELSYYRERLGPTPSLRRAGWEDGASAAGFAGGDVPLVTAFDLGADGATVGLAGLRAALASAANRRSDDTATWTFSAVRSSGTPSAGTFAAAGSVTIEGTGRYLSVWARCTLASRADKGSIDPREVRFRYAPA